MNVNRLLSSGNGDFYLLVSWLKSLNPVINYCHELRFHVKSFSSYRDQLGRTLADLMKDGVKVFSLFRLFWKDFMAFCFSCLACLVSFHCRPISMPAVIFMLFPCLIWLVTPKNLLLLLLSVHRLYLSFEMDWSYPLCWNECVTLCLLSIQFSKQSCAAF